MKLKINIDEKQYEVDVEVAEPEAGPARLQAVESAAVRIPTAVTHAPAMESHPVAEDKVCRSPVSGVVASVIAQAGQKLQIGDVLLVLEAMKMETQVAAHVAGTVAAVKVKPGDGVQSGQVLVEFD